MCLLPLLNKQKKQKKVFQDFTAITSKLGEKANVDTTRNHES